VCPVDEVDAQIIGCLQTPAECSADEADEYARETAVRQMCTEPRMESSGRSGPAAGAVIVLLESIGVDSGRPCREVARATDLLHRQMAGVPVSQTALGVTGQRPEGTAKRPGQIPLGGIRWRA